MPGEFVTLASASGDLAVGHVEAHSVTGPGVTTGFGRLLGSVHPDARLNARGAKPFESAIVAAADTAVLELVHESAKATLAVGTLASYPGVDARLLPHRFNRHTFWCGQSGSGKTFALGVLIEQLLSHTDLPVVIFDPNSDFVKLDRVRPGASEEEAELLRSREIRILRPDGDGEHLRARFTALPFPVKAALLRLDPLLDRDEYNTMLHLEGAFQNEDTVALMRRLLGSENPGEHALALRIDNLNVLAWSVWAREEVAATEVIVDRPNATVLDLGGFEFAEEPLIAALSVLDDLWARREERRPILIVIDEAHNLCSPDLTSPLQVAIREQIMQIAAEGRKFGLWLLLSTQRPSKVHPSIISQCDNLALMKMSSPHDLEELGTIFGFAPAALVSQSPNFRQGEALFAGGFAPGPVIVQVRDRLTVEGGVDVPVPLRGPVSG
ncbi:ATP-binding protein [Subtercola frigoramans]|uniref:DNA helicase HerA-like ATPase n=1 Tax=Subtercola frigoramans TaxID=120298 RepID=A0ABS2L1X3_9MICO|nr:ATP-binding protein [Subtercola frigoramans]MBM7471088.1 DNA helicase HerA-like ATPase [Subtercola frigoramans]